MSCRSGGSPAVPHGHVMLGSLGTLLDLADGCGAPLDQPRLKVPFVTRMP